MSELCESVTERIALGEPLGELRDHAATCARCERLRAMPPRFAPATERPDPGLGFAARMTIGAQHKLVRRRRQRIAATAGGSVAAAALVFALTRSTTPPEPDNRAAIGTKVPAPVADQAKNQEPVLVVKPALVQLVNLSDTKRAARESARWGRIRKPLRPYIQLVKGVMP